MWKVALLTPMVMPFSPFTAFFRTLVFLVFLVLYYEAFSDPLCFLLILLFLL
jgi:hypothetical protein